MKKDWLPVILVFLLGLAALPFVGDLPTWVTLTVAGLAMGMMIFLMAAGLTLVFGLMDVLNFAHGIFISVGEYGAATVLTRMSAQMDAGTLAGDLSAVVPAALDRVPQPGDCFAADGCAASPRYRTLDQISPGSTPFAVQLGARLRF